MSIEFIICSQYSPPIDHTRRIVEKDLGMDATEYYVCSWSMCVATSDKKLSVLAGLFPMLRSLLINGTNGNSCSLFDAFGFGFGSSCLGLLMEPRLQLSLCLDRDLL